MAENASKGGSGGGFFGRLTSFGGGNAGVRSLYRFCLLLKVFFGFVRKHFDSKSAFSPRR
jgi:hypothetical protein